MPVDLPAFPIGDHGHMQPRDGMTLRDYFAGKCAVGMIASYAIPDVGLPPPNVVAEFAFRCADAMLAERERKP